MTINVVFSGIVISIDPKTQAFLLAISKTYTDANLQALIDLKASMQATKAKIDSIDIHSSKTGTN